jgi:beta-glucuronidase
MAELEGWQRTFDKPLVMTQYGADSIPGVHSVFEQPWTEEFQIAFLEMYPRVFDRIPAVVGEQVWRFADLNTPGGAQRVTGIQALLVATLRWWRGILVMVSVQKPSWRGRSS